MRSDNQKTAKQRDPFRCEALDEQSTLVHQSNIIDRASGRAYVEFEFRAIEGRGRLVVPRADLAKPQDLVSKLLNANADLGLDDPKKLRILVENAAGQNPRFCCEYVARMGWQDDRATYATQRKVIGPRQQHRRLLPPRSESEDAHAVVPDGNLESWTREVAWLCRYSKLALFMLAVGFAPPLLELVNLPSFGINLFGPSKKGKSTLLLAAASIYGARVESDLPNFAATNASLGETCRLHNGSLLLLNEVGLISGDRSQAYKVIRPCIYQLTEGREYQRHSKSAYATPISLSTYRLVFVSTAEHPMSYYAAQAGQLQDDGELARCVDLPIVCAGRASVVDRDLNRIRVRDGEDAAGKVLRAIRSGCARNGGALPILHFVRQIMRDPDGVEREVRRIGDRFVRLVTTSAPDDVERHRSMCFGVVAAAGQLACRWGLIPIDEDGAMRESG